ncbi:peptide ABC transporter permease [Pontibacillus halophilus JSM 076056 = DSM 19796]|uniref:Peptide ABC transporter permease n=1 Tax=Pontibacillus halophilus JSM 076056 = DSM 19796 TaxID=1385510 RepID=A0A0A5GBY4_9BACI|nr:oligopeptide ABC transporter permease [Pontibacillus halophilus]KGX90701.1 peptide ABC transporter permease [Pontibacillus halophilus JSM 076056 = DSM 19796]
MELSTKNQTHTASSKPKKSKSPWAIARRKFFHNKLAMTSLIFLLVVSILSFLAPYITTTDISRVNIGQMSLSPSSDHWLGTDKSGRDVFTRLLYGGRVSLYVGIASTALIMLFGISVGAIAGYYGGLIDTLLMRFTDFILNLPFLVFAIVINAIFFGKVEGTWLLILVLSVLGWGGVARLVRSKFLAEKENEYILAAVSIGTKPSKIIMKHLLPNVLSTIIVQITVLFAVMISAESALSYLGFGVPQEVPSWGNMLSASQEADVLQRMPWIWIPPAIVLTVTILSINFIGEGIKDALNPKSYR